VTSPIQGPAFSWPARWVALWAVLAVFWQAHEAWLQTGTLPDRFSLTLFGLGGLGLLYGLAHIWRTQTSVDDTHIRQSGWSHQQVEIAKLTQVKLIYVPYLSWLISPRLVVRTGGLRSWVFHAADRAVLQRFWQLAHHAQLPPDRSEPPSAQ
jgi:hypothetical protein